MVLSLDNSNAKWENNLFKGHRYKKIFELIEKYKITHFGGAPIVLNMITGAAESDEEKIKS